MNVFEIFWSLHILAISIVLYWLVSIIVEILNADNNIDELKNKLKEMRNEYSYLKSSFWNLYGIILWLVLVTPVLNWVVIFYLMAKRIKK